MTHTLSVEIIPALMDWYNRFGRPMPWGDEPDPWHVMVGVVMLQQTTVTAVLPYLERFIERYPTPAALAEASQADVLKSWSGLGYYARARNLHDAAQTIVGMFDGEVPRDYDDLSCLPGIGDYSAGAICSIAYGDPVPALDANGLRIIARLLCERNDISRAPVREYLSRCCERIIMLCKPGPFNQALMDFGALVCTANEPHCLVCPLRPYCCAHQKGRVDKIPAKKPRRKTIPVDDVFAVLMSEGKYYIHQYPSGKLLMGMWHFPNARLEKGESVLAAATRAIQKEVKEATAVEEIGQYKHNVMHYRISGHVVRCECPAEALAKFTLVAWDDLADHPMAGAMKKALKVLEDLRS